MDLHKTICRHKGAGQNRTLISIDQLAGIPGKPDNGIHGVFPVHIGKEMDFGRGAVPVFHLPGAVDNAAAPAAVRLPDGNAGCRTGSGFRRLSGSIKVADLAGQTIPVRGFPVGIGLADQAVFHCKNRESGICKSIEKFDLYRGEFHRFRDHGHVVAHFADSQPVCRHAAHIRHHGGIPQVECTLMGRQCDTQFVKLLEVTVAIIFLRIAFALGVFCHVGDVAGGQTVDQQDIGRIFAVGKDHPHAAGVIGKLPVIGPPGLMEKERSRIVPLADAPERITFQMRAEQVGPADHLIIQHITQIVKRHIPAASGIGFREQLIAAGLGTGTPHLRRQSKVMQGKPQTVHAGNVEMLIMRHHSTVGNGLGFISFFANHVAGQHHAVLFAPFAQLFGVTVHKTAAHSLPETDAGTDIFADGQIKFRDPVHGIFAPLFLIFSKHVGRIGDAVAGKLGFIREKPCQILAFFFRQTVIIFLINDLQKCTDHFRIGVVHIEGIDFIPHGNDFAGCVSGGNAFALCIINGEKIFHFRQLCRIHFPLTEIFQLISFAEAVDFAVTEPAGPAVFVISPCVHTGFCGGIQHGFGDCEPFIAHVRGLQTAPGMHEKPAHPGLFHQFDLPGQFFGSKISVPAPERNGPVLCGGISKQMDQRFHFLSLNLFFRKR